LRVAHVRIASFALVAFSACRTHDARTTKENVPEAAPASASAPVAPASGPIAPPDPLRIDAVEVPEDARALVLRGPHAQRLAIVYLHGLCVYPGYYVESFRSTAADRGELLALQGDVSCGGDGFLHRWSMDVERIDRRIDAAFVAAGIVPREIVLVGYSQGADRAEALASRFPAKYRAVVLIASSSPPSPARLRGVRAAVLMAGTRDVQTNAREGLAVLSRAHVKATFIPLSGAWHGHMGSDPEREMGRALDFVEAQLGSAPAPP
jgi:predicted esterase